MFIGTPLISEDQIQKKVKELAYKISADYANKDLLVIGVLKGSFMFFSDLIRYIQTPLKVDFIIASSYIKDSSSGEVKIHYFPREEIQGKDVLLVDDIIDTGISLKVIREKILSMNPSSLKICVFLDKTERRVVDVPVNYTGFKIPNKFVVGYGLDYHEMFRNLPYITVFKKEVK
ncbi:MULTISPECIES: hypoxanthine phosphoribosyltransferase [Thermodesulfovibrio]|uniref:Hypoxanthine phosphoribosyltransferase n=2 Tax=Thermodesulfovibrio yellowstonii TaxID=28262 RepID=B5YJJ8_THEYD|nr:MULTISPECIES: hypoxanthine phosphoribosyltransferase [Thermodesulfovibrio]ACI21549.1 hypoxanthine phosphoribosyltransferase [Thermodesulfovibrio yellowstonii DSM 11347]MDI6864334.1 hypoxanthine phosphoribosyltransferase [Thermodesulfovibrio yellowstonii]GLI54060.1 hypoxanthine phosphoribosyltransferase [Thermodesulfovibrio islandicus]